MTQNSSASPALRGDAAGRGDADRVFLRPRSWAFRLYLLAFVVGLALWGRAILGGVPARDWAVAVVRVALLGERPPDGRRWRDAVRAARAGA
ncbi:hypothetical protein [Tomitella fengzijianii]|uniref:Uncharacterized protein n=1 Tax=Tomitella fengzijianii TaxID=2597660 RepID=A0A516X129_9ACTN|nr:hypothetical protein [Tomitella fengzijianii]QDQ96311.1 hypothetical protein FO059_01810 [Tomitella fengzijianii]